MKIKLRDRVVVWIANGLMNTFASQEYRAYVSYLIARGAEELKREIEASKTQE